LETEDELNRILKRSHSNMVPFTTKFPRPIKFSNPHGHFNSKTLSEILRKNDDQLDWYDFNIIFHFGTPAGDYSEIIYFLPWVLKYLMTHPSDISEFFNSLIFFISNEERKIRKDNLFVPCIESLYSIFKNWTSMFKVIHYDRKACEKKQWLLNYKDIVENSHAVSEFIDALCYHSNLSNVAISLVKYLSDINNEAVRSAWYLEYVYSTRKRYEFYSQENNFKIPGDINLSEIPLLPATNIPEIFEIISDNDLARKHYLKIKQSIVLEEKSPTYWKDLQIFFKI